MPIKSITAETANEWIKKNEAVVIDVREPSEFEAIHIAGAHLIPVATITEKKLPDLKNKKIIVHCRLGKRGETACERLLSDNPNLEIYNMEGGIVAWESAGFKVEKSGQKLISIERQVQITIGAGVLLGIILGYFVYAGFFLLAAFFGAGLLFAGLTGSCALAVLMSKMPWNRKNEAHCHK